jgi:hypothetical protein
MEVDPLGFTKVHVKIDGKNLSFISSHALRIFENLYNFHVGTAVGRGNISVNGGNFDLGGLGLTPRDVGSKRNGYLAMTTYHDKLSPIIKTIGSIVQANSYGPFNPDPIKLKNVVLNFINEQIKINDAKNDFIDPIKEIISTIKIQRCWEEILITRQNQMVEGKLNVNALDLQNLMGRPGFANKLVFA